MTDHIQAGQTQLFLKRLDAHVHVQFKPDLPLGGNLPCKGKGKGEGEGKGKGMGMGMGKGKNRGKNRGKSEGEGKVWRYGGPHLTHDS